MPSHSYNRPLDGQVRLMTKAARMYHERGIRQADIARALNISQAKVSRLLKRAASIGIVRTTVTVAPGVYAELEERLETEYGLAEAVVVDVGPEADDVETISAIGAGAAAYLEATLSGTDRVGISSWSQTLLAMVDRMRPMPARGATEVVQLLGGVGAPAAQSHSNHLLGELARILAAEAVYVPAPGIVVDADVHDSILGEASMRQVAERWRGLTMAVMGVGSMEPSDVLAESGNAFSADDRRMLVAAGAVGDICHRTFRADGSAVQGELDARVVAISASELRRIPRRVGVAGSARKIDAIVGAARGGWINALVTDVNTAHALIGRAGAAAQPVGQVPA